MITRGHRFHGYGSLRYVYQHGRTVRAPLLSARISDNERRKSYRVAVVVSKKVDKSAVVRNRIRRRVYEVVRQLDIKNSPDIVITVFNAQTAKIPINELQQQVKQVLHGIIE